MPQGCILNSWQHCKTAHLSLQQVACIDLHSPVGRYQHFTIFTSLHMHDHAVNVYVAVVVAYCCQIVAETRVREEISVKLAGQLI
jgi:hypothetical protein